MNEHAFGYAVDRPVVSPVRRDLARLRVVAEAAPGYDGDTAGEPGSPSGPVDPRVALQRLREAVDLVAAADLDGLSDRGLLEHTVAVDVQTTRLEAQRLAALGRVDEVAAFTTDACVTAGSWLTMRTRRDSNVGARFARWTRRLARFPLLRSAFQAGDITVDHVLAVLRAARGSRRTAALVDHEGTLVALARRAGPRDVRAACQAIIDAFEHAEPDDCSPSEARQLYHSATIDGLGDLRGLLDPVTAERLDNLLHAYSQPDNDHTEEERTPAQARHDAFDAILRAAEEHPDVSHVQGAKPHLVVFADILTLLGRDELASRATKLASGREVDLQQILHLLHDAKCSTVLSFGPFRPVAFGRTRRTIPDWLRPLLAMLHATCAGPGCDRPVAWTQAAHQQDPWAHGGTTELDTTLPLCPGTTSHHTLVDIVGWKVDLDPNTRICTWTSPDGATVLYTHPPDP